MPGRAAAQPRACGSCAAGSRSLPERLDTPFTRELDGVGRSGCPSPTARAATSPTRRPSTRWSATARCCGVTRTPTARWPGPRAGNPNGSLRGIAGVAQRRRQRGRADAAPGDAPSEALLGSDDGLGIIRSLVVSAAEWAATGRSRARSAARGAALPGSPSDGPGRRPAPPRASALDRRRARGDPRASSAATPTTSSSRCSASCGASTARTRARGRCSRRCPTAGRDVVAGRGRAGRRDLDRRRARGRVQDRVAQPPVAPSSRTRARRPASAASCATSSRWAPARSPSSTRCASATRPIPGRGTSSTGSCAASAATATASACRRWAASSCSTRRTRATRWSTSWRSGCSRTGCSTRAAARRAGQPRGAVRLGDRPRRHRRRVGARERDVRRPGPVQAPERPGRRPVRREAAHRGDASS